MSPADSPMALGSLTGASQPVIDRLGEHLDAGTQGVHIAFRRPLNGDAWEAVIDAVRPVSNTH